MHGGTVAKHLPARPNLDHLRKQAKTLLARLERGDADAAQAFIDHLPAAKNLTPARARSAGFRLADAQSAIARQSGFATWPALARYVDQLRALEGEWQFERLQVDGNIMPAAALSASRVLIDGDRFRTESPEATYDGVFTIDVEASPARIDIEFIEGPEAGNWSYGIYELDGDRLTMCLGLTGASRPEAFTTSAGSGHALEQLRRASAERPKTVSGGTRRAGANTSSPPAPGPAADDGVDTTAFDGPMTPLLTRLQGDWAAIELNRDGTEMPNEWLAFGSRVTTGAETKVVFGGQVMVHATMRFDETTAPVSVDYLNLAGAARGQVSLGLFEWTGDEARFVVAVPGQSRPTDFAAGKGRTVSRWRRR
jgi:uncharacterized protein (TIGR03067 family)